MSDTGGARSGRSGARRVLVSAAALLAAVAVVAGPVPAQAAAPAVPTAVTVVAGNRSIQVGWTAPADLTVPVHHYVATTTPSGKTCKASASTSCTITALVASTPYTVTVKACATISDTVDCSAASAPSASVAAGPPGIVSRPTVAHTGNGNEVRVSWTAGSPGAGIASYVVVPSPAVEGGSCTFVNANDPTCVFVGLTAGTSYTFRVTAVGVTTDLGPTGNSTASTASAAIVAGPPNRPGKPTVTRTNDTEVSVQWAAPVGGAPIASYTVTSDPAVGPPADCTDVAALSCDFTGLTADEEYTFAVTAHGAGSNGGSGDSAPSDPSEAITPGAPGAPGTPTVAVSAANTVTVTWDEPLDGSAVTGYTVVPTPAGGTPGVCVDVVVLTCDVTGLAEGVPYTFTVVAESASFVTTSSPPSAEVSVAPPGTPGVPTVTLTPDAPGTVTLSWTAPTDGGSVSGYTVTANPSAPLPAGCGEDLEYLTCVFEGLDPTQSYTFTVTADSLAGAGDPVTSPAVVPDVPGTPGTPTVTLYLGQPGRATVTWGASPPGGPLTRYLVTSNEGSLTVPEACGANPAERTCEFTLDPVKSYSFKVTAVGPVGRVESADSAPVVANLPGVPGTPTVALVANEPGKAIVSWTAPQDGGLVTGYTVLPSAGAVAPMGCGEDLAVLSCTFVNLSLDTPYSFAVRATGPVGVRESAASAAVIPNVPGTPGTPEVTWDGPGTATVRWAAPTTGGPVIRYEVTSNETLPDVPGCGADPTVRTCTFVGLDLSTLYTFGVTAVGPVGSTSSADTTPVVPDLPGVPGTPTITLIKPNITRVSWTAPADGGTVTRYTVTSDQPLPAMPGCGADLNVRTCDFAALQATTAYTFRVIAVGPVGSRESADSEAVVPARPGAPGRPTAVNGAPGTVTVSWEASQGGGSVLGYSVTSLPASAPPDGCTDVLETTCEFTGLNPTESYRFVVTARGALGDTPSESSLAITPGAPLAPGTPRVEIIGPGTVRVSWTEAPAGGGDVSSYSVTSDPLVTPPEGCTATSALACEFTGLAADTPYTFLVTATGPSGNTPSVARSAPISLMAPGAPGTPSVWVLSADTVRLTWTAPPPGGAPVINYTVTSDPALDSPPQACVDVVALTCEFTGLRAGTTYTFLVTANGLVGDTAAAASAPVRLVAPTAPGEPTVALAGPNAVTVSWTVPEGGGPVTGYTVVSDPVLTPPAACVDVRVLTCTFDGLASGTPYRFAVVATGPVGQPVTSVSSAEITPGPPDEPERPTAVSTDVDGQVLVSWAAPSPGAGIAGYTVQSSPGRFGCDQPADETRTSCLVSGLSLTAAYTFRVQAIGVPRSGDSRFSPRSAAVVPGALNAPTDVDVAAADRQIVVSWTPPSNARDRVAYYVATATPSGATCTTTDGAATQCVITGLDNLRSYRVTVTAFGLRGTGDSAPSARSARVRPTAGVPGPPTAVTVLGGDRSAQVSWRAPGWAGDGIDHYVATASGGPSCATADASTLSCPITGLVNGTEYQITVVAIGRAASGNSGPSLPPVAVTPSLTPATPRVVSVTPGAAELTVRLAPGSGGGPVASYTATAVGGPSAGPCTTVSATTPTCVITGVTPGTSYTVTAVANSTTPNVRSAASAPSTPVTAISFPAPVLPSTVPTGTDVTNTLTSSAGTTLRVGAVTTIAGTGYAPFSIVRVGGYPGPTPLVTTMADAAGSFSVPVTLTGVAPGTVTIVAAGNRSTGVRYRSVVLTVTL